MASNDASYYQIGYFNVQYIVFQCHSATTVTKYMNIELIFGREIQ